MKREWVPAAVLIALFFLAACWAPDVASRDPQSPAGSRDRRQIIVTKDASDFPPTCTPAAVADVILQFSEAFTGGDAASLQGLLAPEPAFQWYSVSEGHRNFVTYDGPDLVDYLAVRHQQNERIVPLMLDVAYDGSRSLAHISFVLRRTADDLEPNLGGREHIAEGKAAVDCARQQVVVWSIGMDRVANGEKLQVRWPCRRPKGWDPEAELVACAR